MNEETVEISAIDLQVYGDGLTTVSVQIDGVWIDVLKEQHAKGYGGGGIINARGIRRQKETMLEKAGV